MDIDIYWSLVRSARRLAGAVKCLARVRLSVAAGSRQVPFSDRANLKRNLLVTFETHAYRNAAGRPIGSFRNFSKLSDIAGVRIPSFNGVRARILSFTAV
jgi:hypothetical protein